MHMITPSWVCKLDAIENVFGLMTTRLGKMASRAFESDTPEIPEAGFIKIRGLNPWIVGKMAIPSCINDVASSTTTSNARTRGVNPSMAGGACPFPKFDDLWSIGDSTISSMTTEEKGAEVTLPSHFCRYSSQSFLNPIDIALQLASDLVARGHRLAAIQSPFRNISLSI